MGVAKASAQYMAQWQLKHWLQRLNVNGLYM
jgi:hypothetical protein